jgi:hypothetical protein
VVKCPGLKKSLCAGIWMELGCAGQGSGKSQTKQEVLTKLGLAAHTCNPRAWEAEAGGL